MLERKEAWGMGSSLHRSMVEPSSDLAGIREVRFARSCVPVYAPTNVLIAHEKLVSYM